MKHPHHATDRDHTNLLPALDRRAFLLASAAIALTGCGNSTRTTSLSAMPEVPWPERGYETPTRVAAAAPPSTRVPTPPADATGGIVRDVISRSTWARGGPRYDQMNRMAPPRYITIHHDGMTPFTSDTQGGAIERIELIRRAHLGRGWADIGYHFIIDRGGRIYEARPVTWQGAHVKDRNVGNIGIMALGNFDQQAPTTAQVMGVQRAVREVATHFRISGENIRTHREWAATACPGRNMQSRIVTLRQRNWA